MEFSIERILWELLSIVNKLWPVDSRGEREKAVINSLNNARNVLQQYIHDKERGIL